MAKSPKLRPYQRTAIESARRALTKSGSCILQMPTGAGKTRAATEIVATTRGVIWFVCHRREIIRQAAKAFAAAGIDFGVVLGGHKFQPEKRVQIASVQTLPKRMKEMREPKLVVWDECHHARANTWENIRRATKAARHLGLTATPERFDGKGLSEWFNELVVGPSIKSLTPKYLVPFDYLAPSVPDLKSAKLKSSGDYRDKDIKAIMRSPVLIGDAVTEYKKHADGKRAIVFCASIDASKALVAKFKSKKIAAAHVDGDTPTEMRDKAVADLAAGKIKVLSNVEVFTEGFDVPAIDAVIILRPTKSLNLFLQMVGRVLRPSKGKDRAIILDHAGLYLDHDHVDAMYEWSLEGDAREKRIAAMRANGGGWRRRCPECSRVHFEQVECCGCGHEFATGREIGEYDGRLYELRSAVPEGCTGIMGMVSILNVSKSVIEHSIRRGMPRRDDGFFDIDVCVNWMRSNPPANTPPLFVPNPHDFESATDFSKRSGVSPSTVRKLVKCGMPSAQNGWVEFRRASAWLQDNFDRGQWEIKSSKAKMRREQIPNGHHTMLDFAKRHNVGPTSVGRWVKRGMPAAGIFIPVTLGDKWVSKHVVRPSAARAPDGFMTKGDFADRHGVSNGMPGRWIKRGIPSANGYIEITGGDKWVRENIRKQPKGSESISCFAKRYGVTVGAIRAWGVRGLPIQKAFVDVKIGVAWVSKNVCLKTLKQRQHQMKDAPDGHEKQNELARRYGVTASASNRWVRMGLPTKDGFIVSALADRWIKENVDITSSLIRSKRSKPTDGYMPLKTFARMCGKENSGQSWVSKGMPIEQCGVHIQRGLEWVRDNTDIEIPDSAWPKKKAARVKRNRPPDELRPSL